ncbi:DNA recombination protein RmuC [Georgenia thermotolerans]|uniref:DNA recombination protein RmuC n=1 Tax=Georgenia thermotolerans TaxID=527326 RepID=A0A7J5UQS9_9MICO|nr:DNA recombination protein RmuC [Georgenia thermotolerans]KAE8764778.1 DNA recombination protein RmuC [Georgenia thermotolerans]
MQMVTVVLVVLALVVGAALGFAVATARAATRGGVGAGSAAETAELRARAAAAQARAERLAEEVESLQERARRDHDVLRALAPVQATLTQVGEHVALLERERTEQYTVLTEQLHHARRSGVELQRTTAQLESALRSTSARGQWGEVELRRVLEASGMMRHVDFVEQHSLGAAGAPGGRREANAGRPDVVVHLPGEKYLAVDAKVPMDAYLEASAIGERATGEEAERRERLLAAHARALRGHVDALAKRRYHDQLPGSPELVIMFVPSEGLLASALEADPVLLEHALRQGVAPTSPASLLALLRTTASIWSAEQVTAEARELLALGRTLYERLGVVAGHLTSLGRSLRSSVQHYNKVVGSIEQRLLVTARDFESLATKDLDVEAIATDDAQVRTFTAPELALADLEGRSA